MKIKFYAYLTGFLLIITGLVACKSASKLYQQGNYGEAVEAAVKKLQKKPDDPELKSVLQNAYRYAVEDHEKRIRNHSGSTNELRWEWIYSEYSSLQRMHDAILRSPEARAVVEPIDYASYLTTYREQAAQVRYDRGMRWMQLNDKKSFRNAYNEFKAAQRYKPGDTDIQFRIQEAYDLAVVNVVILPLDHYNYRFSSYGNPELRDLEADVIRNLQNHTSNQFVKFYSQQEAQVRNIRPDQFLDLRFSTLNIGRVRDQRSTREVSKDVVIKEIVHSKDSIEKVYGKVTAKITTTRRTMQSEGNLQVSIRDENNRWIWNDHFRGDHLWATEFSTYTGDERALSEADKQLINRRQEYPPQENEITRYITQSISSNLYNRIRDYYNRL